MMCETDEGNRPLGEGLTDSALRLAGVRGQHYGECAAGPLTVQVTGEGYVHLGWPDTHGGMYVTPRQARLIANDILKVADLEHTACRAEPNGASGDECSHA
jgi:hypothetical protein